MQEIWKDVDGFNGKYRISNFGNVLSVNFLNTGKDKLLTPKKHHSGYLMVRLGYGDKRRQKNKTIHSLVANAFIPNPDNKRCVNHIDGNKTNNMVDNLEWVTHKENTQHAIRIGLMNPYTHKNRAGKEIYNSKPILQYDINGAFIKKWDCISDAARFYKCSPSTIINCAHGRCMSCKGYLWRQFSDSYPKSIIPPYNRLSQTPIEQRTKDGEVIKIWSGYAEIKKYCTFRISNIYSCVTGRQKTAYGYIWKRINQ